MDERYKEVYFDKFCKTCIHKDVSDVEEPCNECLENFANLHSHKPVNYEENPKLTNKSKT